MTKYIAATIGPIFDTMNLVTTPSSLWASSYMFSQVSKYLCEELINKYNVDKTQFIVPAYEMYEKEIENKDNGVGLFHDRIIFEQHGFMLGDFQAVRLAVLSRIAKDFGLEEKDSAYLKEYIMIKAISFEAENPILESGPILDSLELSKNFVLKEEKNPILDLFTNSGEVEQRNDLIKRIAKENLKINPDKWQLLKNKSKIKELMDVTNTSGEKKPQLKKYNYYAIVRADGDRVGYLIKSLKTKDEFQTFSACLFSYCEQIVQLVEEFNGITIYAGGDDLLAILPCESKNGNSIYEFLEKANTKFKNAFNKYREKDASKQETGMVQFKNELLDQLSLSFGVFIAYHKFPLYEAMSKSAYLLFGKAKEYRNCAAITIQKHAGQTASICIDNRVLGDVSEMIDTVVSQKTSQKEGRNLDAENPNDKILLSAFQKIIIFESLFNAAYSKERVDSLFKNTFDGELQLTNSFLENVLPEWYIKMILNKPKIKLVDQECNSAVAFAALLRQIKFFIEKVGDNDD